MFIVSGTKRSGTSMWMQAIAAAGVEILGDAFPRNWENGALRQANPGGFYEGLYRDGIFFGTNPDPRSGNYLRPEDTRGRVVKVFIPGVVRSELAFIEGVIANVRDWREYATSVSRLWELEEQQRRVEAPDAPARLRVPGPLEWWHENFSLLRDQHQRGYPLLLHTYRQVLTDPLACVERVLDFVGAGDSELAAAAVKPSARTQSGSEAIAVEPRFARVFDELYYAIENGTPIEGSLLRLLAATNEELQPRLFEIKVANARKMMDAGATPPPLFIMAAAMG